MDTCGAYQQKQQYKCFVKAEPSATIDLSFVRTPDKIDNVDGVWPFNNSREIATRRNRIRRQLNFDTQGEIAKSKLNKCTTSEFDLAKIAKRKRSTTIIHTRKLASVVRITIGSRPQSCIAALRAIPLKIKKKKRSVRSQRTFTNHVIERKKQIRPKVVIDEETNIVWNFHKEKLGCHTEVESDLDREVWWQKERQLFNGRVASFIGCMHLIQGNRRFSEWKGSVLDSVIGVFLTQNVSDYLSSSAFMELASKFPLDLEGLGETSVEMDTVDWNAVRCANVKVIAEIIKTRGMNDRLAKRIKLFLNRLLRDHGSLDLEWLRDVSPNEVKKYLLRVKGLGLKSVECVRLLTLHQHAFPVDTNVGRICVRLGWVPIQPLPETTQFHLLESYPELERIQKYLWPRLCKLDQHTLYELHYQMITFGKVFCTKKKPNCNACPMKGQCKHFASAFARLALPAAEERSNTTIHMTTSIDLLPPPQFEGSNIPTQVTNSSVCIVEFPSTSEAESIQVLESDIEDFVEDPDEIPMTKSNIEEFKRNLQNDIVENMDIEDCDIEKALVTITPEVASIPLPKLKLAHRLRTEHQAYELPDSHYLLKDLDQREQDDPSPYLFVICSPGETPQSAERSEACGSTPKGIIQGTLLIPCRTAMRGAFPLNGTYFQVNEVFADHHSSHNPISVCRELIWNLPRRMVYMGVSTTSIFRGLTVDDITTCFWEGYICVRGFDRKVRAPRPLAGRLHQAAKQAKMTRKGRES